MSKLDERQAYEIGVEAYLYFYSLVTMDVTRRIICNVPPGVKEGYGPANTFLHMRAFPRAEFRDVVRPNFDTLYSAAWLDLTNEPMIVSTPDTRGRYYLLPMLDMWSDVFAVPGKRTSGTEAANYAVVPPGWTAALPAGVARIDAPTPHVWIIGRTQTNGPQDYPAVHEVQNGFRATPLSQWGRPPTPPAYVPDPTVDMKTPPLVQVNSMSAGAYFAYAAALMSKNPPHTTDWSMVARLARVGIEPGKAFDLNAAPAEVKAALPRAAADGLKLIQAKASSSARMVNGWQLDTETMGVYGNHYLIHFDKDELPPVGAFWSVTMYDAEGFQAANALNRFAIGDRDDLKYNADGSLDLYIQHASPGKERESNWLPAPRGPLGVTMRLYAPKAEALDGRWSPPPIRRVK